MTTIRIRGIYAVALTQLFCQHPDAWEIVQPDEEVRACMARTWRMDSPDVDIDDTPDDHGRRETIRLAGPAAAIQQALAAIQQHCFDGVVHQDDLQVGAIYMGLVGIMSRAKRRAVIYLGNQLTGVLPLRFEDHDLRVGSYIPVRIDTLPTEGEDRPVLSASITLPGRYAVLTSAKAVRLSKQIVDPGEQERLKRLGEGCDAGGWGLIWRTAAQHTEDQVLMAEIQQLVQDARALRERLEAVTNVGYVHGGDKVIHVYLAGHAKAVCDTLRTELLPTLPGHHKYKAQGDVYAATVDALEKELPPQALRTRTMTLGVLSSVDPMQPQPIQNRPHLLVRELDGTLREQGVMERLDDDLHAGWLEVRQPLRHKDAYPRDLRLDKMPGDYTVTRFEEGSWSYTSHFYGRSGEWKAAYACLTTPLAIFADQVHVVNLHVAVLRGAKQKPEIRGLQALQQEHEQGIVSAELVRKIQQEAEALLEQFRREEESPANQG